MHRVAVLVFAVHLSADAVAQTWSPFPPIGTLGTVSASATGLISVKNSSGTMLVHEWDGLNWVQRFPSASPPPRDWFALAYDSARQRVVLFGGGNLADTWEWTGTNWVPQVSLTFPPARSGARMVYDSARSCMVLFGGGNGSGPLSDTWEYNAPNWVQVSGGPAPSGRGSHAMAYDPIRQRTVLFGGWSWGGSSLGDTWEWDGSNWTQRFPATSPLGRQQHGMCFDPYSGGVLVFGGCSGGTNCITNPLGDAHSWNGTSWVERTYYVAPSWRFNHEMALDVVHQTLVVLGGYNGSGPPTDFALRFPGTIAAAAQPFGTACGSLSLASTALPILGLQAQSLLSRSVGTIGLPFMSLGLSEHMLGPFTLPLPLSGFGFTGCWLHHDAIVVGTPCAIAAPDQATYSLGIPNQAALSGMRVYLQGWVFDASANPGGIITSNALRLVSGNF